MCDDAAALAGERVAFPEWAMLGSNQRPLPCEGSAMVCWRFLELAKFLQQTHLGYDAFLNLSGDLLGLLHRFEHQRGEQPYISRLVEAKPLSRRSGHSQPPIWRPFWELPRGQGRQRLPGQRVIGSVPGGMALASGRRNTEPGRDHAH